MGRRAPWRAIQSLEPATRCLPRHRPFPNDFDDMIAGSRDSRVDGNEGCGFSFPISLEMIRCVSRLLSVVVSFLHLIFLLSSLL